MTIDTITVPTSLTLAKSRIGKRYHINLNNYRNWHYQVSNNLKKKFAEEIQEQIEGKMYTTPISLRFTLYKQSRRLMDRSNVLSIIEKFFCDALTNNFCIPDDSDEYISSTTYTTGGIDKDNPRVVIKIYGTKR